MKESATNLFLAAIDCALIQAGDRHHDFMPATDFFSVAIVNAKNVTSDPVDAADIASLIFECAENARRDRKYQETLELATEAARKIVPDWGYAFGNWPISDDIVIAQNKFAVAKRAVDRARVEQSDSKRQFTPITELDRFFA